MPDLQKEIDHIRKNTYLPAIAESFGVQLKGHGNRFSGLCPFHPDRNPSLSVSIKGEIWRFKCWSTSCDARGDVFDFVGLMEFGSSWTRRGEQFKRVYNILSSQDRNWKFSKKQKELSREQPKAELTSRIQNIWDIALKVCTEILLDHQEAVEYLRDRGYGIREIKRWRFGFWPRRQPESIPVIALKALGFNQKVLLESRLIRQGNWGIYEHFSGNARQSGRIICADLAPSGLPRALVGRILPSEDHGVSAKYLYLPDFEKPVFGAGLIKRNRDPVILVEGVWNMITLDKWGLNAVAVGGARLSRNQAAALNKLKRPLIPLPDLDEAGEKALESWAEDIPSLRGAICLPKTFGDKAIKDVNDLDQVAGGKAAFLKQIEFLGFGY